VKKTGFCSFNLWSLIISAAMIFSAGAALGESLYIPGTGACEPILTDLAAAFNKANPAGQVIVPPSTGSGGGINAVLKGEAPLARIARPLKPTEIQQGLIEMVFARDAVSFVVGRQVKITNLSADQLAAIFSGKITNWKEVGGQESPIRVIAREPGDSSLIVLREQMKGFRDIAFPSSAKIILYDRATVETLEKYKNSVGFITMSSSKWAKGSIKTIAVDNVGPTRENILAGKYRLVENYALIYKKMISPLAKRFIDFVFSPEGRKIMENNGLIAVERK
jgi:phosphate transport system substrate-binding protein